MRKITVDQTPNRSDERERILNNNGFITNKGGVSRVDGEIAVSRAIGDKNLKQYLISEPEIMNYMINEEDDLLVLSTDGIFLVYKEQQLASMIFEMRKNQLSLKVITQ